MSQQRILNNPPSLSGHVPNPQDPERNKQLADSMGNKQPIDTGLPSTDSDEGTVKTTLLPEGPRTSAKYQVDKTQSTRLRKVIMKKCLQLERRWTKTSHPLMKKLMWEAVKEDPALNKKVVEATEAYTTNSNNITELLSLARTFDFSGLKSLVETMKAALDA
ncbi:hypothetical protein Tco_0199605 [Tanacetum coccineum]